MPLFRYVAAILIFFTAVAVAEAEPRIALVIGNSGYGSEIGALPNPANDAALISDSLKRVGFTVITVTDANLDQMKEAIKSFGHALATAGPQPTGLFFYAGHGLQVAGENYLIPLHAEIQQESDVMIEALPASMVLDEMQFAGSGVNIVILDACRNNPLSRGMRSAERGLAEMKDTPTGSFIAYSTAPGQTASDGTGKDSPYANALAATLDQPGLGIEEMFRTVRGKVMADTKGEQVPWDASSLTAPFYFDGAATPALAASPAAAPASTSDDTHTEEVFWDSIKDSHDPKDFQAYLQQYPHGSFVPLANNRLAELSAAASAAPVQPAAQAPASASTTGSVSAPATSAAESTAPPDAAVSGEASKTAASNNDTQDQAGETTQVAALAPGTRSPAIPAHPSDDFKVCAQADARPEDRIAHCESVLGSKDLNQSSHVEALTYLGIAYDHLNHPEEAAKQFQAAMALDPHAVWPVYNLGHLYVEHHRYLDAERYLDQALTLDPANADAMQLNAVALASLGNFKQALAEVDRAIAVTPDAATLYANRAWYRGITGDLTGAVADADRARQLNTDWATDTLTGIYALVGDKADALTMADAGIRRRSECPCEFLLKAMVLKAGGKGGEATAMLEGIVDRVRPENRFTPLVNWMLHRISEQQLIASAQSVPALERRYRLVNDYFYLGEWDYLEGREALAKPLYEKAVETKAFEQVAYGLAVIRLRQLTAK